MSENHIVYLALGSNLGDRAANLHAALQAISTYVTVETTSFLYETQPAYVLDQPSFLNAACRATTHLTPVDLLNAIEQTMYDLGRIRDMRYGPRLIDIDILFYDELHVDTPTLTIPHPLMAERDFVLQPLYDLAPDLYHPVLGQTISALWMQFAAPNLPRVMPIGNQLWSWGKQTYVMGIINVTPDSFSGDGLAASPDDLVARAIAQARQFEADGAHCVDVGGQSTRPGHELIPVEEEMARVVPVLEALTQEISIPISVDTFRREVAQAALDVGASMINDVWGLRYDPAIAQLVARTHVPLCVMHNRVRPQDADYWTRVERVDIGYAYEYDDIIQDICVELDISLTMAQSAGVPRWLLITDPGIGFGKTVVQHLELINRLGELTALDYPLLFGSSRKSFIGKVLGDLPQQERIAGTIATCVLAVERSADIVRVHDVQAVSRAVEMADAVVRNRSS